MENASIGRKMAILIRAQLTAWVVTALLLLLMALLLFKLELNESKVSLGMTAVYVRTSSGLGLYLAGKAAALLHIPITVDSRPGQGTTFTLHLRQEG